MQPLQNDKKYHINDKFHLGGPLNLRGYEMNGAGPHSEGASLGADVSKKPDDANFANL